MLKQHMAACLFATAFVAAPALAQTTAPTTPTSPGAVSPMPGATATSTQAMNAAEFVTQAANSNMLEIQSSQLAQSKAQENRVKDFAQRMIQDHTQAADKLKAAAGSNPVPTSLDQQHTQMLQPLQQASGAGFDRQYVQLQVDAHQRAVTLFDSYAQRGDDQQLKQFAQQTMPQLREHLQMAQQLRTELTAPARTAQATTGQTGGTAGSAQFITQPQPNMWRASQLRGLAVYNNNNERIGDVNEILVDREGRVEAVVIGVGGFLGIGEHDVAVPFNALQWASTDRTAGTGTAGTTAATGTTGTAGTAGTAGTDATRTGSVTTARAGNLPDRAILPNASKDELKNAPRFNYNR